MVLRFFAYIDSIDPVLSICARNVAESVLQVVKKRHFITVLSKNHKKSS